MSTDRSTDLASRRGPATVVIGQRLRPDRHDAYRRWQDDVTAAAARFPGYLGSEATPVPDQQGDATIIYRFDTAEHLDGWLTSTARDELVASGTDLFDAPPTQQVLVGGDDDEPLATVVVSHAVLPTDEATFLEWQDRMTEAESRSPGFRGSELFPPVPGVQAEWTALYRFASAADLERWMASDERRRLLDEGERFQDFRLRRVSGTFGSWFPATGSGADATPMPNWKSALSVLVGLYPTVVLLTLALGKIWPSAAVGEPVAGQRPVGDAAHLGHHAHRQPRLRLLADASTRRRATAHGRHGRRGVDPVPDGGGGGVLAGHRRDLDVALRG